MMKTVLMLLLVPLISSFSEGSTKSISGIRICNSLVGELYVFLESGRKDLPKSWDAFESIRLMKSGSLKHQLSRANIINSLSLVPGSPIIDEYPGISRDYRGLRLFLISREEIFTESSGSGRCAILIKPEELDSKPLMIYSDFITEDTAKLILSKIPNFDPAHQPLAFEDLSQFQIEKKQFRDNIRTPNARLPLEEADETTEEHPQRDSHQSTSNSLNETKEAKKAEFISWWIIASSIAILILALVSWLILRRSKPTC